MVLAGLPVLANDKLACGLQFITPDTGQTASADGFADGITAMLNDLDTFQPRKTVLENWTWPHSGARLAGLIEDGIRRKEALSTFIDTDRNGGLAALAPPVSTSQNRTLSAIRYRKDLGPMSSQPIGSSQRMGSAGQSKVKPPLLCFSHLRWDFVVQRPQHLMRLFAAEQAVWFWEEHIGCDHPSPISNITFSGGQRYRFAPPFAALVEWGRGGAGLAAAARSVRRKCAAPKTGLVVLHTACIALRAAFGMYRGRS